MFDYSILSKKRLLSCILFIIIVTIAYPQKDPNDSSKIYATSFKINLNGLRMGIEQRISKRVTIQAEGLYLGKNLIKINPQIRYYLKPFNGRLYYFGIGYYYKHQENNFNDSVKLAGTTPYYIKDFRISKYIHALTLNTGYIYDDKVFKKTVHFEFNLGVGIRFKKSERYGILPTEEIDFREAFIMRPQAYQDTKGRFALYPELNMMLTVVLPIRK